MATQASPPSSGKVLPPALPVLIRLNRTGFKPASEADTLNNETREHDAQLEDDLDKLRRAGFIQ